VVPRLGRRPSPEDIEATVLHEALHVILFSPLDEWLHEQLDEEKWKRYNTEQERIVDLVMHYIDRRRPKYGYHESGVPNTKQTAQQKPGRSTR